MKTTLYRLLLLLLFTLFGCDTSTEPEISFSDIKVETSIRKEGYLVVVDVEFKNISPEKIQQCGLYWDTEYEYKTIPELDIKSATLTRQRGGKTVYQFEFFPWDKLYDYYSDKSTRIVMVQAYALIEDKTKFGDMVHQRIKSSIKVDISYKDAEVVDTDLVVQYNVSAMRNNDIIECGIYWGTKQDENFENTYTKVKGENKLGEQSIAIKDGAYKSYIYSVAYAVTSFGMVYSRGSIHRVPGDKMTVSISSEFTDITYEKGTVYAKCTVENPVAYPITERGFCYNKLYESPEEYPTLKHYVQKAEPGVGDYSATLSGLSPFSTYRVRAYAINSSGVTYSKNYIIMPTLFTQSSFSGISLWRNPIIENRNVTLTAEVYDDKSYFVTERGFCYTTNGQTPSIDNNKLAASEGGLGEYSVTYKNLPSGKYIFKAYATNQAGTGYSSIFREVVIP